MGKGTLTICSASAGSGKTYRLTGLYLSTIFSSRYAYRKVLAVTFTNKATAEMKSRILENLYSLAAGKPCDHLFDLIDSTGKGEAEIRSEAGRLLNLILHDYSRFSVSTIDSFFSKIVRSFAREAGLHTGFNFEIDHSVILSEAVDAMITSAASDKALMKWLISFALENIENGKGWNIRDAVIKLSEEIFREKYKILSAGEKNALENKEYLTNYTLTLRKHITGFRTELRELGLNAMAFFDKYSLSDDMFFQKGNGVPGFIRKIAAGIVFEPKSYVRKILDDPPKWSKDKPAAALQEALGAGLAEIVREAILFYDREIIMYNSAEAVVQNLYALGILSDVFRHVHEITDKENSFLLSDAGDVLSLIIGADQTPFIYEKTGNRYDTFMIDEFQDTSIIQWSNFKPLISNSMAEGSDNLVVGDVKQAIYRWRNSDWKILGVELARQADDDRFIASSLEKNYRSHTNIIRFNNSLYSVLPGIFDHILEEDRPPVSFRELYSQAVQIDPGTRDGGYVNISFLSDDDDSKWEEKVTGRLPALIEMLQDKGYSASDIGIIVRDGKEGSSVLRTIVDYAASSSPEKKERYNYNIVSNDSLLLANSPAINFIIATLAVAVNNNDMINRAVMLRTLMLAKNIDGAWNVPLDAANLLKMDSEPFPQGSGEFLTVIRSMPLFEATENIIGFFGLGELTQNVAYLNTFQDHVLRFVSSTSSDTGAFLEWWAESGSGKSVNLPDNQDAIRVLTIHKSKGLEFRIVILPFISWQLDHGFGKQPVLWIKPTAAPLNGLGIVPVKYRSSLLNTIFANEYREEKYSVYLDNLNLLYVATTRAREAIFGYAPQEKSNKITIASVLKAALSENNTSVSSSMINPGSFLKNEGTLFEFGELSGRTGRVTVPEGVSSGSYMVTTSHSSLKLKLHGENYFSPSDEELKKKLNYGRLMHEIFGFIKTADDIEPTVRRMVLDGSIPSDEEGRMIARVAELISSVEVAEWFSRENEILNEASIVLPTGEIRRPDRVMIRDGKITVVDFKFGDERRSHIAQVIEYADLLRGMGYDDINAYLWYVDQGLIKKAC